MQKLMRYKSNGVWEENMCHQTKSNPGMKIPWTLLSMLIEEGLTHWNAWGAIILVMLQNTVIP